MTWVIDSSQANTAKSQRVADHRHRTESHCRAGDNRTEQDLEPGIKDSRGNRHPGRIEHESEEQVLADVAHYRAAEATGPDNTTQVAFDEGNRRAFHRHVGARAHGDSDIGSGERRRVVDAVAGHRHAATLTLELLHFGLLLLGENFRYYFINADLAADGFCRARVIPRHHNDADAGPMELGNRAHGCILDRIRNDDQARELSIYRGEHYSPAVSSMLVGPVLQGSRIDANIAHQRDIAERNSAALDGARDSLTRNRYEVAAGRGVDPAILGALDD